MSDQILRPLTPKEKNVLEFIEAYFQQNGVAPAYQEIKDHFGFASYNSIQRYLKQLQGKGYIHIPGGNQKRAISILQTADAAKLALQTELSRKNNNNNAVPFPKPLRDVPRGEVLTLPLLGKVAAGLPLEEITVDEQVEVPSSMVRDARRSYTLQVKGQSMIDDGIFDGDILIVQEQGSARNGEIAVAEINNEATVKRFYLHTGARMATPQVELRPSNPDMESMWYSPEEVRIRGIVVGLLRKF
jgi:repressor LexA